MYFIHVIQEKEVKKKQKTVDSNREKHIQTKHRQHNHKHEQETSNKKKNKTRNRNCGENSSRRRSPNTKKIIIPRTTIKVR